MTDWAKERKIHSIRPGDAGPVAFLAQLLEQAQAGHIINVVVSIQYDNNYFDAGAQKMPLGDLLFHKATIDQFVDDSFRGSR